MWPGKEVAKNIDEAGLIDLEYEIVWNEKYNRQNEQPMKTKQTRNADGQWNSLQVKFQSIRFQEDDRFIIPFIG